MLPAAASGTSAATLDRITMLLTSVDAPSTRTGSPSPSALGPNSVPGGTLSGFTKGSKVGGDPSLHWYGVCSDASGESGVPSVGSTSALRRSGEKIRKGVAKSGVDADVCGGVRSVDFQLPSPLRFASTVAKSTLRLLTGCGTIGPRLA